MLDFENSKFYNTDADLFTDLSFSKNQTIPWFQLVKCKQQKEPQQRKVT